MAWKFLKEFRDFAVKGNVVDLAVAFILGASFGKIVTSLVEDIIMPPISYALSRANFADWNLTIGVDSKNQEVALKYGNFVTMLIHFVLIAFVVFLLVRLITRFKGKPPEPTISEKRCPFCDTNISIIAVRCPNCTSELETTRAA